jgi:hypothetical protein
MVLTDGWVFNHQVQCQTASIGLHSGGRMGGGRSKLRQVGSKGLSVPSVTAPRQGVRKTQLESPRLILAAHF